MCVDRDDLRCICRDAQGLRGIFDAVSGACLMPRVVDVDPALASHGIADLPSAGSEALRPPVRPRKAVRVPGSVWFGHPTITFWLPDERDETAATYEAFRRWSARRLAPGAPFPARLWAAYDAADQLRVHVGDTQASSADAVIDEVLNPAFTSVLSRAPGERDNVLYAFEPDVDMLDAALGLVPTTAAERAASLLPAVRDDGSDAPARLATVEAYARFSASLADVVVAQVEDLDGTGCRGACRVRSSPTALEGGRHAIWERVYRLGEPAREMIWVFDHDDLEAALWLTPGRTVGLVVTATHERSYRRPTTQVRLYDRMWRQLGSRTYAWPGWREHFLGGPEQSTRRPRRQRLTPSPALVLCEGSVAGAFEGFEDDVAFSPHIRFGPHRLAAAGHEAGTGSLLGWYANPNGSLATAAAGVRHLTFGFLPPRNAWRAREPQQVELEIAAHGTLVMSAALQAAGVDFIPVGGTFAFEHAEEWLPAVRGHARVVSASVGECLTSSQCQRRYGRAISEMGRDFLWVVAAGNDPSGDPHAACPAQLAGLPNLLVVGGSDGDQMWRHSSRGIDSCDLAADAAIVTPTNEAAWGTSFATPRVAAIAAELAEKWPDASADELRTILLVSARPTAEMRDKVRAAGILDAAAAHGLATCLRSVVPRGAVAGSPCTAPLLRCMASVRGTLAEARRRCTMLQRRGVWPQ